MSAHVWIRLAWLSGCRSMKEHDVTTAAHNFMHFWYHSRALNLMSYLHMACHALQNVLHANPIADMLAWMRTPTRHVDWLAISALFNLQTLMSEISAGPIIHCNLGCISALPWHGIVCQEFSLPKDPTRMHMYADSPRCTSCMFVMKNRSVTRWMGFNLFAAYIAAVAV